MPTVRGIVDAAARDDHKFSSVVLGIVESVPFRERVTQPRAPAAAPRAQPDSDATANATARLN
jgi:hypothetical protein